MSLGPDIQATLVATDLELARASRGLPANLAPPVALRSLAEP